MNEAFDVVGIGYAGVDHLCEVGEFPRPGEKILMRRYLQQGGGQIGTAMVALARWGLEVSAVVAVGDDELGGIALRGLEEEGVDVGGAVVRDGVPTQTAFIMAEDGSGERTIVYLRDPRLNLTDGDVDLSILEQTRCLYLDGHEQIAVVAARRARELGVPVVLDCERIRPFTEELLGLCDVVLCDNSFPGLFTELEGEQAQLTALSEHGMGVLGMTLGDRGSVLMDDAGLIHCPAFVVDAVDSTGAGDVFHAGFTFAWLEGATPEACLEFGNAAAALKCTALGGRTAIPRDAEDIRELVRGGERR